MTIGTKSLLFGYHQFIIHPLLLAICWTKLYGFPFDPRLWFAFFVHDLGYFGKPNMDGPEGQGHVWFGAGIMGTLFDNFDSYGHKIPLAPWPALIFGWVCDRIWGRCPHGKTWYCFAFYHSRFMAKRYNVEPSKLCYADKAVIAWTPTWIQLGLMRLTGEWREYVQGRDGRTPMADGESLTEWANNMRGVCRKLVNTQVEKAQLKQKILQAVFTPLNRR